MFKKNKKKKTPWKDVLVWIPNFSSVLNALNYQRQIYPCFVHPLIYFPVRLFLCLFTTSYIYLFIFFNFCYQLWQPVFHSTLAHFPFQLLFFPPVSCPPLALNLHSHLCLSVSLWGKQQETATYGILVNGWQFLNQMGKTARG